MLMSINFCEHISWVSKRFGLTRLLIKIQQKQANLSNSHGNAWVNHRAFIIRFISEDLLGSGSAIALSVKTCFIRHIDFFTWNYLKHFFLSSIRCRKINSMEKTYAGQTMMRNAERHFSLVYFKNVNNYFAWWGHLAHVAVASEICF